MHEVAEPSAAERIISHVLDDAAGISVGVGVNQVFRSGRRPTLQKQRLDVLVPSRIDNGFGEVVECSHGSSRTWSPVAAPAAPAPPRDSLRRQPPHTTTIQWPVALRHFERCKRVQTGMIGEP